MTAEAPFAEIIIGEDNPADSRLITLCLEDYQLPLKVTTFHSGRALKEHLSKQGLSEIPTYLFLDFFLAEIEGPRLLQWIRSTAEISLLPVIMMSGSYLDEVREKSYEFGGNYFLEKSTDPERFFSELNGILTYYFRQQRHSS